MKVAVIALKPEARCAGIGRRLMQTIETEAIRLSASGIYLVGGNAENRGISNGLLWQQSQRR